MNTKTQVKTAGYLSRKLILLLIATQLSEVEDCGYTSLLPVTIKDERTFNRYTLRNYKEDIKDVTFTTIAPEDKDKLLGKTIYVASPITCNLSNDNKVCKKCYGKLADINQYHAGLAPMLVLTEQIIQRLLSTKHLLQVNAVNI